MMKLKASLIIGTIILILFITGCSTGQKTEIVYDDHRVVLKLGADSLTMADIDKRFEIDKFDPADELRQRKIDYVNEKLRDWLLIRQAIEAGVSYNIDSSTFYGYKLKRLYQNEVYDNVSLSESEIRSMYDKFGGEIQMGLIMVTDSLFIDSLYNLLENGGNFSRLAKAHSIHSNTAQRGGSTRYIKFGSFGDEVQIPAFNLEQGEYTKPFKTFYGWNIVTKFDQRKKSTKDLESKWRIYHGIFLDHKNRRAKRQYRERLLKEYNFRINNDILSMVLQKGDSVRTNSNLPPNMPVSSYLSREVFSEDEINYELAVSDVGGITINDFLNVLENYNPYRTPDISKPEVALLTFEELAQRTILLAEMSKLGIDSTSEFLDDLIYYERKYRVSFMMKEIIGVEPEVTGEAIARYYEEHKTDFISPEQAAVNAICFNTKNDAEKILEKLENGANFKAIAKKYSVDKWTGSKNGDLGFITAKSYPELFEIAKNMKVDEISGPIEMWDKYWVITMKVYRPESQKTIDIAKGDINNRVRREYRENKIFDWVEDQKKLVEYYINHDILNSEK